jgi:SAM-dependent methyltransferase
VPPDWRLPEGVDRALWTYTHDPRLAAEEAAYFSDHPLLEADLAVARAILPAGSLVADLGCGTGRAALALAREGYRVVAVDLSRPMLERLLHEARAERLPVLPVQANLCDLRGLADDRFDAVLMLFSTLGMIRGRVARRRALAEAARLAAPHARLILHAHNLWHNLSDRAGRLWLIRRLAYRPFQREPLGDRPMTYRAIPHLVVHQYRLGELRSDLAASGWRITTITPLDAATARIVPGPRFLSHFRCGGWLLEARRRA